MANSPFSARNRGPHRQIDSDFPPSARIGLMHLLSNLVEQRYIAGWPAAAKELQRIARLSPATYDDSSIPSQKQAKADAKSALDVLSWDKVYDFCERLHSHVATAVGHHWNDEFQEQTPKTVVQAFITGELQRLFAEEGLAFEFAEGLVRRRGRKHTVEITTKAQVVLGDPRLGNARRHYDKAMQFFRHPSKPDFENTAKEAVCAVEAAGKALFPEAKVATLGDLVKWLTLTSDVGMPKALGQTISGVYGYRSGGDGVGHGGSAGGEATAEVAEYVLAICASQIIYLVDLANAQERGLAF